MRTTHQAIDSDLRRDARRHGVELAAPQPDTIDRPEIYWTGWRWGIRTGVGTSIAFAATAKALRAFAHTRYWGRLVEVCS